MSFMALPPEINSVTDVFGCGFGPAVRGRDGLGRVGLGAQCGGVVVRVGDLGADGPGLAGSGVAGDDGGGRPVQRVVEPGGLPGGGGGRAGPGGGERAQAAQTATVQPINGGSSTVIRLVQMVMSNWFGSSAGDRPS